MQNNHSNFHKDEQCLNCGIPLIGKFCSDCGQKANLHKDSFWHMLIHFVGDYFHYDGKFWRTLKTMFLAPGIVTLAFINGKRVKYLNPISLYIFVSTLFFLFISYDMNSSFEDKENEPTSIEAYNKGFKYGDSIVKAKALAVDKQDSIMASNKSDFSFSYSKDTTNKDLNFGIGNWTPKQKTYQEYKLAQAKDSIKDSWFKQRVINQYFKVKTIRKNGGDLEQLYAHAIQKNFPKAFFILLPLYALLLSIFYRKQKLFYVDHAIHSVHIHTILFIITGLHFVISNIITNDTVQYWFSFLCVISFIVYLFLSLKKVYQNSGIKSGVKLLLMGILYTIGFFFTLLFLLIISFFMI